MSANKSGDAMKQMQVEMHPVLLAAWYCSDVKREVALAGAKVVPAPELWDPALVMWARHSTVQDCFAQQSSSVKLPCDRALYIMLAGEVANHVSDHSLAKHVSQIKDLVQCAITLVVFGVKDYFKTNGRRTQNSDPKPMTEIELEMAITDLLVSASCDTVIVNTSCELALLVAQCTKALAGAPAKKAKRELDEQADFYMRGDNKQCIAIDKDGQGMARLWQQMVAVLPQSSLETSRAICAQYPTPRALYEALQTTNAVNEIADVGVARAAVPGARARRVGPEFARKLHTLFTADDGNVLLE